MSALHCPMKRSAQEAGLENPREQDLLGLSLVKRDEIRPKSGTGARDSLLLQQSSFRVDHEGYPTPKQTVLPNGKKTKGRVKIKMEFIDNKLRRYTTFSKRKTGIMKKAYELSTLTGTQVMLLVASETGHVYTFATRKLQPMITSEAGKVLIQTCLNSPDLLQVAANSSQIQDQRMSATGYEETELSYVVNEDEPKMGVANEYYMNELSCSGSESSSSPTPSPAFSAPSDTPHQGELSHGLIVTSKESYLVPNTSPERTVPLVSSETNVFDPSSTSDAAVTTIRINNSSLSGSNVVIGGGNNLMFAPASGLVYAPLRENTPPVLLNLPSGLQQMTQEQNAENMHHLMAFPVSHQSSSVPTDLSLHIKRECLR